MAITSYRVASNNPLPNPIPELTVREGQVLENGVPLTQPSYVVFDVRRVEMRTRDLSEALGWDTKLREAEDWAREVPANRSRAWRNDPTSRTDSSYRGSDR